MIYSNFISLLQQEANFLVINHKILGLEEDIKQKKFESSFQKALLNIIYTSEILSDDVRTILKSFELTEPQYNILRILAGSFPESLSPRDIKKVMIFKKSDMTRLMDRLSKKALVSRKVCLQNRRQVDILITKKGQNLLDKVNPQISEKVYGRLSDKLTVKEAQALSNVLDKIRS